MSVIERRYDNAVEQDIYLFTSARTPGQNAMKVQFFGTVSPFQLSDNKLTSTPVTQAGTAVEMRDALPGIRMARSSIFVQNNYGPFGYAFGHGAGSDLCMFAWQQLRSPTGTISPLANFGSIQVRVRICRADATEEQLLAFMYNYTITGSIDAGGWNPYGEPQPVSPTLGGVGAPIYPRPIANEPIVSTLPASQPVVVNRPARAPMAMQQSRPVQPLRPMQPVASGALIPSPAIAAQPLAPATTMAPPAVYVPRPFATSPSQRAPAPVTSPPVASPQAVSRVPLVPSPASIPATGRNPAVPSPCTSTTSGAANACR